MSSPPGHADLRGSGQGRVVGDGAEPRDLGPGPHPGNLTDPLRDMRPTRAEPEAMSPNRIQKRKINLIIIPNGCGPPHPPYGPGLVRPKATGRSVNESLTSVPRHKYSVNGRFPARPPPPDAASRIPGSCPYAMTSLEPEREPTGAPAIDNPVSVLLHADYKPIYWVVRTKYDRHLRGRPLFAVGCKKCMAPARCTGSCLYVRSYPCAYPISDGA